MTVLTYVLIRSTDSFCASLVSFRVCCSEFPHCWLLAATVLVESTAISSRTESIAEEKGTGQLWLSYITSARELHFKATSGG